MFATRTGAASLAALLTLTAACGSSGTGDSGAPPVTADAAPADHDDAGGDDAETAADDVATADDSGAPADAPVDAGSTSAVGLDELPELLLVLEESASSGVAPLAVAKAFGFPFDLAMPDGSTLERVEIAISRRDDLEPAAVNHDFYYAAIAPGGAIPAIDGEADDHGPGAAHLREVFDESLGGLGYDRADDSNVTGPREPGGPSRVSWRYRATDDSPTSANGVAVTSDNVMVLADEDISHATRDDPPGEPQAGYAVSMPVLADANEPVIVPILAELIAAVPLPNGALLDRARMYTSTRASTSPLVELGRRYGNVRIEWLVPAMSIDETEAFYANDAVFADDRLVIAEPSSDDESAAVAATLEPYGEDQLRGPLMLLGRHSGVMTVEPADGEDPVTVTIDISLHPFDAERHLADG
ncbi:MAG: hypothetical protein WBP59_16665 [Ilumatobacteraceae bacterium]